MTTPLPADGRQEGTPGRADIGFACGLGRTAAPDAGQRGAESRCRAR